MFKKTIRTGASLVAPFMWKHFLKPVGHKWKGKNVAVTLSFNYECPDDVEQIPKICELFSSYGFEATHACTGRLVQDFPKNHLLIVEKKHEIINHAFSSPSQYLSRLSTDEIAKEITGFEKVSENVLGLRPKGFRCPNFGMGNDVRVYEILEERRYVYSSSTNLTATPNSGLPYNPSRKDFLKKGDMPLLELPVMACPSHFYPLFDDWHCFRGKIHEKDFIATFNKALDLGEKYNLYLNFSFHARFITTNLESLLRSLAERDALVVTCLDAVNLVQH
ncbi:polysaccharide deacetylase family protein [Candidatus Micrarchaeota archaeon]|nr:polysaccharide deacetylase family protein [Candidatus Micrarchaeota archaeon]